MASNNDPKAELHQEIKSITDNLVRETETEISKIKDELKDKSVEELNAFVDEKIETFKNKVCRKANEVKNKLRSYMPSSEPKRSSYASIEEYQQALAEYQRQLDMYRSLVGMTTSFLSKFWGLVDSIMDALTSFFKQLWEWVRQAAAFVARKISDFVSGVRDKVSSWWNSLFG